MKVRDFPNALPFPAIAYLGAGRVRFLAKMAALDPYRKAAAMFDDEEGELIPLRRGRILPQFQPPLSGTGKASGSNTMPFSRKLRLLRRD